MHVHSRRAAKDIDLFGIARRGVQGVPVAKQKRPVACFFSLVSAHFLIHNRNNDCLAVSII
jgi:hypothetical protein